MDIKRIKDAFQDIHLYKDKIEMAIKVSIWTASWIGGIVVHQNENDEKNILGSTYFLFSLSLLMEFLPQIKNKKELAGRIFHAFFCILNISILFIAMFLLFANKPNDSYIEIMFNISKIVMLCMYFDLVILFISDVSIEKNDVEMQQYEKRIKENTSDISVEDKFLQNLIGGNLGNIEDKEEKNE